MPTAELATLAASFALPAISRIEADISSALAATVFTLALTCSAAADTVLAWTEVSSAEAPIWVLVADSSSELDARVVADSRSESTSPDRSSTASLNEVARRGDLVFSVDLDVTGEVGVGEAAEAGDGLLERAHDAPHHEACGEEHAAERRDGAQEQQHPGPRGVGVRALQGAGGVVLDLLVQRRRGCGA